MSCTTYMYVCMALSGNFNSSVSILFAQLHSQIFNRVKNALKMKWCYIKLPKQLAFLTDGPILNYELRLHGT